jgi:hypothetical protein
MSLVPPICLFAARQLLSAACAALGLAVEEKCIDAVFVFLTERFTDQSQRLRTALESATERAWKALEVALAGESFWNWLDRAEDRSLREQIRAFLDSLPAEQLPNEQDDFRRQCLLDLRAARKAGRLSNEVSDLRELASAPSIFN